MAGESGSKASSERAVASSLPFRSNRWTDPARAVENHAHVLIVEDSDLVSDALRILFESADYRVSIASTVAAALSVSRADPPDLTLLDLTLPDGDGLTLVEPLHVAGCKTVVALTGHDDYATRERCLA